MHAVAKGKGPSFLWPRSIPLCKCTTAVLPSLLLMDTCAAFQILAVVHNAAPTIQVQGAHILSNWFFWILGVYSQK